MLENGYGTVYYTQQLNFGTSGTLKIIGDDNRWDLDTLHVKIESLDAGGSLTIGYGPNATDPPIHVFKSICDTDVRIRHAGIDNKNQQVLNAVWSGGQCFGSVNAGAHIVKQDKKKWIESTASAQFSARYGHQVLKFGTKMYLLGGTDGTNYFNDVWSTSDGITWTQIATTPFSARAFHTAVVLGSNMYVMGGYTGSNGFNDVWSSPDGITWTSIATTPFTARYEHSSFVKDGLIWVVAGTLDATTTFYNDVWSSPDGITWTQKTASASFVARYNCQYTVFQNNMWILGGSNSAGVDLNDAWHSSDGITWIQSYYFSQYTVREGGGCAVLNGNKNPQMFIVGGFSAPSTELNDTWTTPDGSRWVQENSSADFSARQNFGCCVFNNSIWVIGGLGVSATANNEVWRSNVSII